MTFEEWWSKTGAAETLLMEPEYTARVAWAFAERTERDACAKVCDQHAENMARHGDTALAEQSRQDAVAIRARSNLSLQRRLRHEGESDRT